MSVSRESRTAGLGGHGTVALTGPAGDAATSAVNTPVKIAAAGAAVFPFSAATGGALNTTSSDALTSSLLWLTERSGLRPIGGSRLLREPETDSEEVRQRCDDAEIRNKAEYADPEPSAF
jgi:hypothetical protein